MSRPGPVSATLASTARPVGSRRVASRSVPPSGMAWRALVVRLRKTWTSAGGAIATGGQTRGEVQLDADALRSAGPAASRAASASTALRSPGARSWASALENWSSRDTIPSSRSTSASTARRATRRRGRCPRCQSWTVERMPASGLRTSCATPASSLPSAASRSERRSSVWSRSRSRRLPADGPRQADVSRQRQGDPAQRQARRQPVAPERAVEEQRVDQPGHRPGGGDHPASDPDRRGADRPPCSAGRPGRRTARVLLRIAASTWSRSGRPRAAAARARAVAGFSWRRVWAWRRGAIGGVRGPQELAEVAEIIPPLDPSHGRSAASASRASR